MDISRKANREGNEKTLQYKSRQETLLDEELLALWDAPAHTAALRWGC